MTSLGHILILRVLHFPPQDFLASEDDALSFCLAASNLSPQTDYLSPTGNVVWFFSLHLLNVLFVPICSYFDSCLNGVFVQ